jgi:hypothetical protein
MAKLRTLSPLIRPADLRVVQPAPRARDSFYDTKAFRLWRTQIIARADGRCEFVDRFGVRCSRATPECRMVAQR